MSEQHEAKERPEDQSMQNSMRLNHLSPVSSREGVHVRIAIESQRFPIGQNGFLELAEQFTFAFGGFMIQLIASLGEQAVEFIQVPKESGVVVLRAFIAVEHRRVD